MCNYDENGLPYYLLEIKVPEAGAHLITVDDPCLSPTSVSKSINSR
jgi:hypothetical protein